MAQVHRTHRRGFVAAASGMLAAAAAAICSDVPNVIAQPKIQWRMSTPWDHVAEGAYHQLVAGEA